MKANILIPIILYMLFVFALSAFVYYKNKHRQSLSNYFIGERSMNGFLLAMTLVATYVSASSFIGGPGAAYKYGLGWVLLAIIQVPTVLLSLGVLGKKFAILARQYNAITLSDMLYARYQSRLLIVLASVSLIIAFIGAMTVQLIGAARLLESAAGIPYSSGLVIFGLITAIYTTVGGFKAGVLNDALQGMIMIVGALLLLVATLHAAGGVPHAMQTLKQINPDLLAPHGADHFLSFPFMTSFWVLVCFGVIGLPHTAVRCFAYKDSTAVHRGIIIGTLVVTILMFTLHLTGVLGRTILPHLTIPDEVIPRLMVTVLPPIAAGIFLAAPLAAIMSTVNAQLLQSSSALIKDLYLTFRPDDIKNTKTLTRISSLVTLVLGLLLILTAWRPPDMIIWLNLLSFGGLEAVFLWPLVLGLYWERANATGALCSMIFGAVSYSLLATLNIKWYDLHPIIPALLLSLVAFLVGNHFHSKIKATSLNKKPS